MITVETNPVTATPATERVTGVRIVTRQHHGIRGGGTRQIVKSYSVEDLADVAIAFDEASDEASENVGSYGNIGCGSTWVEVTFDDADPDDEDADSETIRYLSDDALSGLEKFGSAASRKCLRRFVREQQKSTVWDGSNHVECCSYHAEKLLGWN